MVPPPRTGAFSPNPALQTGISHSPHPSQTGGLSTGGSPSTSSPTGSNSLVSLAIAQAYVLLSTIKENKDDPTKWDLPAAQLRKIIDDHGMEVFTRYFTRLVAGNASQIFPGINRPGGNAGNYQLLVAEMRKISHDVEQARKIAESIETGTEDIFRDFDLSTFMEHFKLDALEKTILALAFKLGSRTDLKTKADAILSTNFPTFVNILSKVDGDHEDLSPAFTSVIVDRFIQHHPPNFTPTVKQELRYRVEQRYSQPDATPPSEVLAALDLMRVLGDKPSNALAQYIQRTGPDFTRDEDSCATYLQNRPANVLPNEEQVAVALTYTTISQTPQHNPFILVSGLRRVLPATFRWQDILTYFDQRGARISSSQFLHLYNALLPIAQDSAASLDIQHLWGGNWENPETQLSFIGAFTSLTPEQLDATTIPGLESTFTLETYAQASAAIRERAAEAVKHPLVSLAAISAIFHVALHSVHASTNVEAKRLFQDVVVPNLDIFVVSAFGVPKPWPILAVDTLNTLFSNFLNKSSQHWDFVFDSLWRKDKQWVTQRLIETHAQQPGQLPLIFEHAVKHDWLNELMYLPNGFGLDLTAYAHAQGLVDLDEWARNNAHRRAEIARSLLSYLLIKADIESQSQRLDPAQAQAAKNNVPLQLRTISAFLNILEDFLPGTPLPQLIQVQRSCITTYARLINYGEGFDDIINDNGKGGHALPPAATIRMEEHFKKMYGNDVEVRAVVEALDIYKTSREPLDQDVFACMIHSLFDEYNHLGDYPLEALATTAVLFGGIISHKLISDLPLQIGLGMILEAVRDHSPDQPMYKFGLQALIQLFPRFREWPGFCRQLLQVQGLRGTEAWKKAEEAVKDGDEEGVRSRGADGGNLGHVPILGGASLTNGNLDDAIGPEQHSAAFAAINVDPLPPCLVVLEDPSVEVQGKIQFVLNNLTETTLQTMFAELRQLLEDRYQQWFASHLVEERAKMQPNYHKVYLDLVNAFDDKSLWAEVLRETYVTVSRMLNSEVTLQNSTERTHLKNLGGWLGLLTLARDKPIRHKNIAFKQLLIEAHDTKRLIVVIPFVCKVLTQGEKSNIFKPPNPWLMDIIHFLIELYHNAELKLNLKFEIEVLCKSLSLDHKSIEPSGEIRNRPLLDEVPELPAEALEPFENLSLNGIGGGVAGGLSPHSIAPSIPDLGPSLSIPQVSEMVVSPTRLHDIVRNALTRALQEIIQPVVDRSVAIAAIATQQMVHKDFATEPDENRIRTSAINMVKATAGSLALVTSREPLRANFTNYMRSQSNDLPQGLPEGTIILCVNSNTDLASSIIEKSTEERAISEIEEMLEGELEARRRHRMQRPAEPYVDASLSRWAMTIPNPYKLSPSMNGLNGEQMAIYEDFARQPRRTGTPAAPSHVASSSDATRSMANEVLQDQYSSVPSIPTPAETPAVPSVGPQLQQPYSHVHGGGIINGRQPGPTVETRNLVEKVQTLVVELQRSAREATEDHFADLPRPHQVLDIIDALVQTVIRAQQTSEDFTSFAAEQVCQILFVTSTPEDTLSLESAVHVLETLRKIAGPGLDHRLRQFFHVQPGHHFLRIPLIAALLPTDLLDWRSIDNAMASALRQRKDHSLDFLQQLLELTLLNDSPLALYSDFVQSLEAAWAWIVEDPDTPGGQQFKSKVLAPVMGSSPATVTEDFSGSRRDQMEYVFEEWVHVSDNAKASDKAVSVFVEQMRSQGIIKSRDDFFIFARLAMDKSIDRFEMNVQAGGSPSDGYTAIDALTRLVAIFVKNCPEEDGAGRSARAVFVDTVLALGVIVLNHHHIKRGDRYNQRVFFRFFSMLLHAISGISDHLSVADREEILLHFAARFNDLGPAIFPGFAFAWLSLIEHRIFLPALLRMPANVGWAPFTKILVQLFSYLGEQLKIVDVSIVAKDIYRSTLKLLVVLHHDFPEYLAAHHVQLCETIPPHCTQLLNMVLVASPASNPKMPDPSHPGLKGDRMDEHGEAPADAEDPAKFLARIRLLRIMDQALQAGPSEEVVANIKHAINTASGKQTTFGHVPVSTSQAVIDAVVAYIGNHAVERIRNGGAVVDVGAADFSTLSMVVHELSPEGRYYFLCSMVNQLRYSNSSTNFFSQALLEMFGHDMGDPEEMELREQICRILLERLIGFWPQPWGLMVTFLELVKNDKYMFFDQPFLKAYPELSERLATIVARA